ncbi:polysaccharide pyruvyl transferase family protein [Spirillospora sp. NPDC029432]|uniref:polysaccharide pyruvyl transferase family protein n=1 Tax=Spirillospora sp. NPDC029432 TaxID=3154599 RepID=UPI0034572213
MRVLVTGWPSFVHGEATAGDVLAMEAVRGALAGAGAECDVAWSPVLRPDGLTLDRADPGRYTHLVFACGPAHGDQVESLHRRYARCRRIAVGVSVIDPDSAAVTGFDVVLPRDAPGAEPRRDLSAAVRVPAGELPVVGVVLAPGQGEYGGRGRHGRIEEELTGGLAARGCARVPLDTRVDPRDWRHPAAPGELEAVIRRLDLVVTTRLHGLVLALRNGVPALAVDPVGGGAKVTAQARAWDWPAVITTGERDEPPYLDPAEVGRWWDWCLSPEGGRRAAGDGAPPPSLLADLVAAVRAGG